MSDAPRYPDTDGKSLDNQVRELKDYIVNLHRYIRYAINNIDVRNMTLSTAASVRKIGDIDTSVSEIMQDMDRISLSVTTKDGKVSLELNGAGGGGGTIDLTGMVTFENLAVSDGKTVINADNITTGKISAVGIELEGYWSDNYYRKVVIDNDDFSFYGGDDSNSLELRSRILDTGSEFYSLYHTPDETLVHGSNIAYVGLIHTRLAEGDDDNDKLFIGGGLPGMAEVPIDLQITSTGNLGMYSDGVISITGSSITLNGAEPLTESSVVPIANGGTGATAKNAAANNLCEVGTWTPTFECYNGNGNTTTAPTVTIGWKDAYYVRFGDFCYIYMGAAIGISNIGGGYAQIGGLPFEAYPLGYQGDACQYVYQCLTNSSNTEPIRAVIGSNAPNKVRLRDINNVSAYKWKVNTSVGTNAGRVYFAFMYRIKS